MKLVQGRMPSDTRELERLQRELADHWMGEGRRRVAEGDMDGAVRSLKRIAEDSEHWRSARILLGEVYRELGQWGPAATCYTLGLADEPVRADNVAIHYEAGLCALEVGRMELAVDHLDRVQAFDPDHRDTDELLARLTWFGKRSPERVRRAAAVTSASRRFERGELLGQGTGGTVYRARDTLLDREVAVKTLSPDAASVDATREGFLKEARAAASLSHRNIVAVHDFGVMAGELFLAMELVSGPTLRDVVRRDGPLSPLALRSVVDQACDALGYAHGKGVIHLDIKPANLIVTANGLLKITDFGLSKCLATGEPAGARGAGGPGGGASLDGVRTADASQSLVAGTPFYMAPERIRGEPVTPAVDIYALGVTLFELATGEVPFREGDIFLAHAEQIAPNPSQLRPDLPPWVDRVVDRCLRKDPGDRYASTDALRAEMQAAAAKTLLTDPQLSRQLEKLAS